MAKTKISEFSATPGNNTDIDGINIAEGCAPSGINDAIRELMAQLKDFQAGTAGDSFNGPVGTTTAAAGAFTTLTTSSTVTHNGGTANGVAYLNGSKVLTTGSALVFDGTNLGLGVTPSAWQSVRRVLQVGGNIALWGQSSGAGSLFLSNNTYFDGTNFRYLNTSGAAYYSQATDGSHGWNIAPSGTAGNAITFTQAMTLDASGNLAIGKTSTSYRLGLQVANSASNVSAFEATNATNASFEVLLRQDVTTVNAGGAGNLVFATGGSVTERARIDSSGNWLVGKAASAATTVGFEVGPSGPVYSTSSASTNSSSTYHVYSTGAGAYRFYVGLGGTVYATSTTITAISDQRLKENIQDLDAGLDAVMALKPRKFDWKPGKGKDKKGDRGWIAQEFEQVFPDMIDEWRDPAPEGEEPYKAVNADLIPVLVKAIQEQQAIINQINAKVEAQAAEIAALKGN